MKSNLVLIVLCVTLSYIQALDNYIHHRHKLSPSSEPRHHVRLHKRSLEDTPQVTQRQVIIPLGNGQYRTAGLIDKLSDGIAQGLSKGLSAGITDGITGSIYALPSAIEGSLNNLKNPGYAVGGYSPNIIQGNHFSPAFVQGNQVPHYILQGNQLPQGIYGTITPGFSAHSTNLPQVTGGSYSLPLSGAGYSLKPISLPPSGQSYSSIQSGLSDFSKIPLYHNKPAPVTPYHWDCNLIPAGASYGNKLFKFASGDEMDVQVKTLSQLIQLAGADSQARSSNEMDIANSEPMMAFYEPLLREMSNILPEVEARKNMALFEEINMNLPPLGMVDSSKLVTPQMMKAQGTPHGSNANVVLLLVPSQDQQELERQIQLEHQQHMDEQSQQQNGQQKAREEMRRDEPMGKDEISGEQERRANENYVQGNEELYDELAK